MHVHAFDKINKHNSLISFIIQNKNKNNKTAIYKMKIEFISAYRSVKGEPNLECEPAIILNNFVCFK